MTKKILFGHVALSIAAAAAIALSAGRAEALDKYQDRRGLMAGIGMGGGAAIMDGEAGGAVLLDVQLGGGASDSLVFGLDTDLRFQFLDARRNVVVAPGPQLDWFLTDGLFLRAGVAMALMFVTRDDTDEPTGGEEVDENDFEIGFDAQVGIGWEFFATSNLAIGVAAEGGYTLMQGDDVIGAGFHLGLRYY